MDEHAIEYDLWIILLIEWGKNVMYLGKGMKVAVKDFDDKA